mmetsp:Transcript_18802/g.40950  ORF Transcript_18802/g.40950 Transcript_18802/m.40950 type:complete len:90 (+) Transcript_18802:131-400(+)
MVLTDASHLPTRWHDTKNPSFIRQVGSLGYTLLLASAAIPSNQASVSSSRCSSLPTKEPVWVLQIRTEFDPAIANPIQSIRPALIIPST